MKEDRNGATKFVSMTAVLKPGEIVQMAGFASDGLQQRFRCVGGNPTDGFEMEPLERMNRAARRRNSSRQKG